MVMALVEAFNLGGQHLKSQIAQFKLFDSKMHYHGDNTVEAFLYYIKTVLICILKLLAPSCSIALYMAVYGGIDRIQACLTDKLN